MHLLRVLILTLCMAAAPMAALCSRPQWETVQNAPVTPPSDERNDDGVSVTVHDGYIYVTTAQPVTVRVMTILGQPISQHTLPEGTSRLKVSARGIYILKAGNRNHRVTI